MKVEVFVMSITTIKRLVMSSTVISSFKKSEIKFIDEDGNLTKVASILGVVLIIVIVGFAGGIEMDAFR